MDALNSSYNFQQQMQLQMQQQQQQFRKNSVGPDLGLGKPPAGSLIISDFFTPSNPQDKFSHGEVVNMSARQNGFRGPVITADQPNSVAASRAISSAENVITDPNADKQDIIRAISQRTAAQAVSLVETQTQVVRNATASGAENSVLNLSMGGSKAGISSDLYSHAAHAWSENGTPESREYGATVAGNYAKAYGLDLDRLQSTDPKVAEPERAKLQQHLINHVDHTVENSGRMKSARQDWSTEVRRFESGRNSVVISAGNHGDESDQMMKDAGSSPVMAPPDYQKNFLEIPEVTSVGATRWLDGENGPKETAARYSSRSDDVDIYASGSVDYDGDQKADDWGTSFSAPRVGATMAELHRRNPNMSSSQVENLMRNQLTHNLNTGSGDLQVLDYQKSSDFLVGAKR
jgi:subtilase family protein